MGTRLEKNVELATSIALIITGLAALILVLDGPVWAIVAPSLNVHGPEFP